MSTETLTTEAWPTVIFDNGVGKLVTNIEVDIQYLADTMSREGMADDAIERTTIHFTDRLIWREDDDGEPIHTYGEHDRNNHTAYAHIGSLAHYEANRTPDEELADAPEWALDELVDIHLAETVLHELHHEIDDATKGTDVIVNETVSHLMQDAKPSWFTKLLRRMVESKFFEESNAELQTLLTDFEKIDGQRQVKKYMKKDAVPHDVYLDEPSEVRAREFSERMADSMMKSDEDYPIIIDLHRKS